MAHWKTSFPSKYFQAAELDTPIDLTIATVPNENVGLDDESKLKPIAYFSETEKGCVLNVTRCEAITGIAGTPDMDRWHGVRVRLQRGLTRYQGKRVACIEIVAPPTAPRTTVRDRAKPASAPLAAPVDLGEPFEEPPIPAPEAEY